MDKQNSKSSGGGKDTVYRKEQVASIINSVIVKVQGVPKAPASDLQGELMALKEMLDDLHQQLGQTGAAEISDKFIPTATDELGAIVEATEQATESIMLACENIQELVSGNASDLPSKVEEQITRIFEACTFQDITGQRITKIVKTLKKIDERITALTSNFEGEQAANISEEVPQEVSLLNGPALPQNSISQEDIDKLLAEFDQN